MSMQFGKHFRPGMPIIVGLGVILPWNHAFRADYVQIKHIIRTKNVNNSVNPLFEPREIPDEGTGKTTAAVREMSAGIQFKSSVSILTWVFTWVLTCALTCALT